MSISKIITSASFAFALIGGGVALAPTSVEAAGKKHISYEALNKNRIPCSKRGSSSVNCKVGKPANKYNRGCSTKTRCKRS